LIWRKKKKGKTYVRCTLKQGFSLRKGIRKKEGGKKWGPFRKEERLFAGISVGGKSFAIKKIAGPRLKPAARKHENGKKGNQLMRKSPPEEALSRTKI